jgi:hypothetical protein
MPGIQEYLQAIQYTLQGEAWDHPLHRPTLPPHSLNHHCELAAVPCGDYIGYEAARYGLLSLLHSHLHWV